MSSLLENRSTSQKSSSMSIGLLGKLKKKAHHWQTLSHHHVNDHAMAIGFRTPFVGKQVEKHWGAKEGAADRDSVHTIDAKEEGDDLQTNSEAIGNLLNNCLGSGILAVPHAMKELGLGFCLLMLVISVTMNRFMLLLVMKVCDLADIHPASYNGVAHYAFGGPGRVLVVVTFVFMGFGCMVSYVAATNVSINGLATTLFQTDLGALEILGVSSYRWICVVLLFPPTYIRSLKSVALLSVIAFIGALVMLVCVVSHCFSILMTTGMPQFEAIKMYPGTLKVFIANLPITMTVFSIQAGGSIILSSLKSHTKENVSSVATNAFGLAYLVNICAGIPAYLVYLDRVPGDVLEVMTEPNSPLIAVAQVAVLVLVVLSYMFMMIPCRVSLLEGLFNANEGKQEASYFKFAMVTTVVNVSAMLVNKICSDLSLVLGLTGAVAVNLVAFILPSAIYIKVRSKPGVADEKPVPTNSPSNIPFYVLIVYGFASMIFGLYMLLA